MAFIVLSFILVIAMLVAESRAQTPDYPGLLQNMVLSVVCSIIASDIFCLLQDAGNKDQEVNIIIIYTKLGEHYIIIGTLLITNS